MPKLKTNRGAAKRFKRVGKGGAKFKFRRATRNHILTKRTRKNKRSLRPLGMVDKRDLKEVANLLRASA